MFVDSFVALPAQLSQLYLHKTSDIWYVASKFLPHITGFRFADYIVVVP